MRLLAAADFYEGERVVAPLAFGGVAHAAYIVMAIGVGRAKRTQFNWAITGVAAAVSVGLNLLLIPPYGIMGAAVATVVAYVVMFIRMTWYAQRVFPDAVPVAPGRDAVRPGSACCSSARHSVPSLWRSRSSPPTRSPCCCSASSAGRAV